jgi:predicted O-methyltransferase YrrM
MSHFTTHPGPADLHAWPVLRALLDGRPYLPFSSGAMRASGLVHLCNHVFHTAPDAVVECGSGTSTVVLARLLAQRGHGRLVALEHDPGWAAAITRQLEAEGLAAVARVVLAPLQDGWYAAAGIDELPARIDLLVVDGPPADTPELAHARHPALGRLEPRLGPTATVVLDDIGRAGEREVLRRWEAETPWRFEVLGPEAIAVGRRQTPS